jgi:hypothetical protein
MCYISRLNSSNFKDRTLKSLINKKPTVVLVYSKSNTLSRKALDEFKLLSFALHKQIIWKYINVNKNYLDNSFYANKLLEMYNINSVPSYLYFNDEKGQLGVDDSIKYEIYRNMKWYIPLLSDLQWDVINK